MVVVGYPPPPGRRVPSCETTSVSHTAVLDAQTTPLAPSGSTAAGGQNARSLVVHLEVAQGLLTTLGRHRSRVPVPA